MGLSLFSWCVVEDGNNVDDSCKAKVINMSGHALKISFAWTSVSACLIVAQSYSKIHPIMAQKTAMSRLVQRWICIPMRSIIKNIRRTAHNHHRQYPNLKRMVMVNAVAKTLLMMLRHCQRPLKRVQGSWRKATTHSTGTTPKSAAPRTALVELKHHCTRTSTMTNRRVGTSLGAVLRRICWGIRKEN